MINVLFIKLELKTLFKKIEFGHDQKEEVEDYEQCY